MKFYPLTNVFTRDSAIALRVDDPSNPLGTNCVIMQPTSVSVKYALGGDPATGFTLSSDSQPVLIELTAPLSISGSVQIQLGFVDYGY